MKTNINENFMVGVYSTEGTLNIYSPLLGENTVEVKITEEVNLDTIEGVNPDTLLLIPANHPHVVNGNVTLVHDIDTFRSKHEEMLTNSGEDIEHLLHSSFYLRMHDIMFTSNMGLLIYLRNNKE